MNVQVDEDPATRFCRVVRTLRVLNESQIREVCASLAADQRLSPVVALLESGLCDHQDLDMVELLMNAESAIPGYELLDVLGRGGMGVVWKARQASLDRIVALKTISALSDANKTLAARFEREAAAVAKLSHPNIVAAVDFGRVGRRLFLAMEYVAGEDLEAYVERNGRVAEATALSLIRQVASGLAHASRQGIIHRDIKPANILLVNDSDWMAASCGVPLAKITDFGLALLNQTDQPPEARLTSHQAAIGSPHYMAPEQLTSAQLDTRTDIYALGATLFHLTAGYAPWEGKSLNRIVRDKLSGDFPIKELEMLGVSSPAIALISQMTCGNPENRLSNCQAVTAEIDQALEQIGNLGGETQAIELNLATIDLIDVSPHGSPSAGQNARTLWKWRWRTIALGTLIVPAVLLGSLWLWASASIGPIGLTVAGTPLSLFDGRTIPATEITEGGLGTSDGRLVMSGSSMSILGYRLPDWEYLKLDAIAEIPPQAILDIVVGDGIADKRSACLCVRFEQGLAQAGQLTKLDGIFSASGKSIALKGDRQQHYVEVEKNQGAWVIRLYKDPDLQFVIPFQPTGEGLPQIIFRSQHLSPSSSEEEPQYVALSELSVVRLKPSQP
jgi:serine/threonine protein kinase